MEYAIEQLKKLKYSLEQDCEYQKIFKEKPVKPIRKNILAVQKAIDILSGKTNMVKGKDESVNALTKLHKLRDSQYE